MNKELEETVVKVADYSNEEKRKLTRNMHYLFVAGFISFVIYLVLDFADAIGTSPVIDFIAGVALGISFGMIIVGVIMTSKHASKIRVYKKRLLGKKIG